MPTKAIYLNDEDLKFINEHENEINGSLSAALMTGFRLLIGQQQAQSGGWQEVNAYVGTKPYWKKKLFKGRQLARIDTLKESGIMRESTRIYLTPKGKYIYYSITTINWNFWSDASHWENATDPSTLKENGIIEIRDTPKELEDIAPHTLLNQAMNAQTHTDITVEVLDV